MNLHRAECDVRCKSPFSPPPLSSFRRLGAACVSLSVRELSQVKHDLEVALTGVLTTREEPSGTSQAHHQEQGATGPLRQQQQQQLLDAEEKVSSPCGQKTDTSFFSATARFELTFNVKGISLQLL